MFPLGFLGPGEDTVKMFRCFVGERVALAQYIRNINPQCHFYAFQGIKGEEAQLLVKDIKMHSILETAAVYEFVITNREMGIQCFPPGASHGVPVATQSVIANALQIVAGGVMAIDLKIA